MSESPTRKSVSKSRRSGLGRGLESLIPVSPSPTAPARTGDELGTLREVGLDEIEPNPWQPRSTMDEDELAVLAESIRLHGVMQPLLVTIGQGATPWTLVAGERRWRAARKAGLSTVPVVIRESAPQAMLELAIIENVVRSDLGPLEEAQAFLQLINEFDLTQQQVADRIGRSRASVANTLRLLSAPELIQVALSERRLSEGHVRAILGLEHGTDQLELSRLVEDKGLNVRQTETLAREWNARKRAPEPPAARNVDDVRLEDRLRSAFGTRVALRRGARGNGGSLTIQFFSDDQLQAIYDKLVGEDHW